MLRWNRVAALACAGSLVAVVCSEREVQAQAVGGVAGAVGAAVGGVAGAAGAAAGAVGAAVGGAGAGTGGGAGAGSGSGAGAAGSGAASSGAASSGAASSGAASSGAGGGSTGSSGGSSSGANGGSAGAAGGKGAGSATGSAAGAVAGAPDLGGAISLGLASSAAATARGRNGIVQGVGNDWPAFSGATMGAAEVGAPARLFSMQAVYFRPEQFRTTADCLTAAYRQLLPLEVCR
jgi:hypothetical protein